jgi:predicted ATPase
VQELAARAGDPLELFPGMFGLWAIYNSRGELRAAYELAVQLLQRAQAADEPSLLMYARLALGNNAFAKGELIAAKEQIESAISLYNLEPSRPDTLRYGGLDAGVWGLFLAAEMQWEFGYPDLSLKSMNKAVVLARELSHPASLAFATTCLSFIHQARGEARAVQETAERAIALGAELGLDTFAVATIVRGWAMAKQGRNEEGIAHILEGLAACRATGAEVNRPFFLTLLANVCTDAGRIADGLRALTEALAFAEKYENRHYEAEAHRLKGELLLRENEYCTEEAQNCFQRAIEIARHQTAKSLELRSTTSLARLLDKQGRRDEARTILADIYNWFTEGFDTADLKDAKALLDELAG